MAIFVPFVRRTLDNESRTDIVWDDYRPQVLRKPLAMRGKGSRKKLGTNVKMPRNLNALLDDSYFQHDGVVCLLTAEISSTIFPDDKLDIITSEKYPSISSNARLLYL